MLIKLCIGCGNDFYKPESITVYKWNVRTFCTKSCAARFNNTGRKMPPWFGEHMSNKLKGRKIYWANKIGEATTKWQTGRKGELSNHWQGGKTKELKRLRNSAEYRKWRESVFVRDDYTCQFCGVRGTYLEADHIKPFAYFEEERFSVENGRTLCKPCHKTTSTYAGKGRVYA